jgi:uncharacterized FlaG/YvyC family protein
MGGCLCAERAACAESTTASVVESARNKLRKIESETERNLQAAAEYYERNKTAQKKAFVKRLTQDFQKSIKKGQKSLKFNLYHKTIRQEVTPFYCASCRSVMRTWFTPDTVSYSLYPQQMDCLGYPEYTDFNISRREAEELLKHNIPGTKTTDAYVHIMEFADPPAEEKHEPRKDVVKCTFSYD